MVVDALHDCAPCVRPHADRYDPHRGRDFNRVARLCRKEVRQRQFATVPSLAGVDRIGQRALNLDSVL
jgi:hypothetical protein